MNPRQGILRIINLASTTVNLQYTLNAVIKTSDISLKVSNNRCWLLASKVHTEILVAEVFKSIYVIYKQFTTISYFHFYAKAELLSNKLFLKHGSKAAIMWNSFGCLGTSQNIFML